MPTDYGPSGSNAAPSTDALRTGPDRDREVIDLIKAGPDFFYVGAPGDLERLSRTAISELRAENEDLKGWAAVGRGGWCVHSKTAKDCAGCQIRVLRAALTDVIEGETAEEGTPKWYALRNARAELARSDETGAE